MVNSPFIVKVTSSRTLNVLISHSQSGPLNGMTSSAMDARVGLVRLNVMPLVALLVARDVAGFSSRGDGLSPFPRHEDRFIIGSGLVVDRWELEVKKIPRQQYDRPHHQQAA